MPEFKCISCGEIKESKKPCSCPTCGYKMFEMPYNRREVLLNEIRGFIKHLELDEVKTEYLIHYRLVLKKDTGSAKDISEEKQYDVITKEMDDRRFPDFDKIRGYVCGAKKTELFREHLDTSVAQIRKHIHESYEQTYEIGLNKIRSQIEDLDTVLKQTLDICDIRMEIPDVVWPEITLVYSETPDAGLIPFADELLDELEVLSAKIQRFIKQNNIYGTAYQHKTKITFKPSEEQAYEDDLKKCIQTVSKINAKKYIVDIFSDGSDELNEMLKGLWNAISAIMLLPVRSPKWCYSFPDGTITSHENLVNKLAEIIRKRYHALNRILDSDSFLADYEERQIFSIYDKLIEMDSFGFIGISKDGLLKIGESENELNALIGLSSVKESVKKIKAYALANKSSDTLNVHMCFYGNPGTGKTEVARIIAGILYENKILPTKNVVEVDRSGLVSQYFGATAEKTKNVIRQAMGGVLFIDEAYALGNNSEMTGLADYGKEAIDTLVKAMEDYRGKFCVIFAGYKNEMLKMISLNPGLRSRIQFELDFPNYSRAELREITQLMLKQRKYTISEVALDKILDVTDVKRKDANFANAREVRNIIDQVIMCQNLRNVGSDDREIGIADVNRYIQDAKIHLPTSGDGIKKKILTGEEELDQLIGLAAVKRMIKKIKAYAKRNQGQEDFNLHMCFYGNPGTGKTEVARILSRILYDAGVLPESKLVETDAFGLLGKFVGETGPKTQSKINEAMNGVLFVDEAYGLVSSDSAGGGAMNYGEEAIAVLLKNMEDHRGQFCVIFAGYKNEMQSMLQTNPGLASRIQFSLDFADYSREELGEIALRFLNKKKYNIDAAALDRLLDVTEYFRRIPNFANARTVRNILDQVIMNQNLRTEDSDDDNMILIEDVEDYLLDEGIELSTNNSMKPHIGFV